MTSRFAYVIAALAALMVVGCGTSDNFYTTPDTTPPLSPVIGGTDATQNTAIIWWEQNAEADLAGYSVYAVSGQEATLVCEGTTDNYYRMPTDNSVTLRVTAFDFSGNESSPSSSHLIALERWTPPEEDEEEEDRLPRDRPVLK